MTFRQFTALATVAKHGNITKAAQALRISQPSLSKHLKMLEEDYKVRLLSRNGKGVQLTEDGVEFLTRVDPILAQLKDIEARYLNGSKEPQTSPLRVGGTHVLSSTILPSLVAVFTKDHRKVEVVLRTNTTSALERLILRGDLEIALTSILPRLPELEAESFVPLKIVAFAAKTHPIARKKELNLADLQTIPLIIRDDEDKRGTTEAMLLKIRSQEYRPNIAMRCDSPEAIKSAVSKKLGVGFLYKDAVREGLASGVFKKLCIPDLPMYGNSYIVFHKQRPLSSNGEVFLNLLRQWRDEKRAKKCD